MDLRTDEQLLLADFRRLDLAGKKELSDYAAFLVKKSRASVSAGEGQPENRCRLAAPEERPEAAKEPIFTE